MWVRNRRNVALGLQFVGTETAILVTLLHTGVLPLAPWNLGSALLLWCLLTPWWEVWFYFAHRCLHSRWLYVWHRPHHQETGVPGSLRFSAGETLFLSAGFYLPIVLAARWFGMVSLPWILSTLVFAFVLNLVSHLPARWGKQRAWILKPLYALTEFHERHHRDETVHFGLLTPVMDAICQTRSVTGAVNVARREG